MFKTCDKNDRKKRRIIKGGYNMNRFYKQLTATCLVLGMCFSGCSSQTEEQATAGETKTELKSIGNETESSQKILMVNRTGKTIEAFFVKADTSGKVSDNLMEDNEFTSKQRRNFFFTFKKGETYLIQFQSEGEAYNLHEFPFDKIEGKVELKLDGDLAYIEYEDADGKTVSTKEFEKNYQSSKKEKTKQKQSDKTSQQSQTPVFVEQPTDTTETQQTQDPTQTTEPVVTEETQETTVPTEQETVPVQPETNTEPDPSQSTTNVEMQ